MPCPKVLHIFVLLLVTACTNIYAEQLKDDPNYCNIDCDKHRFHIATGQKGGAYYEIGKTLTKMLRREKKDPNYIGFVKSQGSVENLGKVIDDPTYVGIIQSDVIDYNHGRDEYTEFKVVGALYHEPLYILVSRKLRLSSISQLRGKKVSIGLKNSGTQHTSKNMLGIFGISLNEVEPFYVDYAETANLLREEEIHAALLVAAKIPEEIKECIEDKRADIMKISTGDLVKIASADPYLYRLLDVNDPPYDVSDESYVVNDQFHDQNDRTDDSNRQSNDNKVPRAAKKRFRTISVTSVLVAHKDADPNLIKQLAEKIHKLCKLYSHEDNNMHQTRVDANSITTETTQLWVRYPFLLYGKKSSEKIFHEKAHSFYQETDFWRDSTYDKMVPYIVYGIPFLFFTFILVGPILFKWPKRMALNNWPKSIRKRFGLPFIICITVLYMSVITLLYILLYTFELDVGNPEITGKAADLGKMFLLSSRLDNIPTVTRGGQIVIALTSLVGGTVGVVVLMRLSFKFFSDKIREALDMIPINIGKHLVILNWTSKVEGIVKELRSGVTRKKPPVKIVAPPSQEPPDKGRLAGYDDVYIIHGDPANSKTLENKEIKLSDADTILVLAEDESSDDVDMRSLKILLAIKNVLKEDKVKPKIFVELSGADATVKEFIKKEKLAKIISYADIKHKLVAQAVITPDTINIINHILSANKDSNELYILKVSKEYKKEPCNFRDFAYKITEDYAKGPCIRSKSKTITVIGVKANGKLHINPTDTEFKEIRDNIDAVVVLAWKQPVDFA